MEMQEECTKELKAKNQVHNLLATDNEQIGLGQIIVCEDYSSLPRLLRVTAYLTRFIKSLRREATSQTTISQEEILKAEVLWILEVQSSLTKDQNFSTWKKQFGLFCGEDGIWRCGGRLSNTDLPPATKHPILLHKSHHFTTLIVLAAHERVFHNGVKETLTEIRAKYWIVRGRNLVKKIIYKCTICRRHEGPSYPNPQPPPLPAFRVKESPPFSYTGVDFAGPVYVKSHGITESDKVWICLYTCCVTRAIHVDIVLNLTAQAFLRSFKRFVSKRFFIKRNKQFSF